MELFLKQRKWMRDRRWLHNERFFIKESCKSGTIRNPQVFWHCKRDAKCHFLRCGGTGFWYTMESQGRRNLLIGARQNLLYIECRVKGAALWDQWIFRKKIRIGLWSKSWDHSDRWREWRDWYCDAYNPWSTRWSHRCTAMFRFLCGMCCYGRWNSCDRKS